MRKGPAVGFTVPFSKRFLRIRDDPNTTTTKIFQKSFASDCHIKTAFDGASDEKLLCFLCVPLPLCRRAIWRGIWG